MRRLPWTTELGPKSKGERPCKRRAEGDLRDIDGRARTEPQRAMGQPHAQGSGKGLEEAEGGAS